MERREKKKMACTECRKRKEKCTPVDRLDDCDGCKEHGRVCIYTPVSVQTAQIDPIVAVPSYSVSPPSQDWQSSIAVHDSNHLSPQAGASSYGASALITSHETSRHNMETNINQMIIPVQCSCNEYFRCIEHDPQIPLFAHLMSDEKMMQNFEPYLPNPPL